MLSVVRTLTECPVTCNALLADEKQLLLELCSMCLVLEHHTAASQAVRILTGIVSYCQAEKIAAPVAYMTQIDLHLESLIYASLTSEHHHRELANYLVSGVRLAEKNFEFGERFVQLVGGILADDFGKSASVNYVQIFPVLISVPSLSNQEHHSHHRNAGRTLFAISQPQVHQWFTGGYASTSASFIVHIRTAQCTDTDGR